MATCKECLRYEVCRADGNVFSHIISDHDVASDICPHFKDKTKYVEQKHGRWEKWWCEDYITYFHRCSVCGEDALTKEETAHDEVLSNYCPNCGAKMDLEE